MCTKLKHTHRGKGKEGVPERLVGRQEGREEGVRVLSLSLCWVWSEKRGPVWKEEKGRELLALIMARGASGPLELVALGRCPSE